MKLSQRTSEFLEDETQVALQKVYFRLENARRLVELYETTLIPQAGAAIEVAETWHQEGPKSIAGFLETQSVWLNFNLARLRAITDYQQNVVRLEKLVGERSMIHIAIKIGLIVFTVWVAGCASHRLETYQELRGAEIQPSAYYYTEVEKKDRRY